MPEVGGARGTVDGRRPWSELWLCLVSTWRRRCGRVSQERKQAGGLPALHRAEGRRPEGRRPEALPPPGSLSLRAVSARCQGTAGAAGGRSLLAGPRCRAPRPRPRPGLTCGHALSVVVAQPVAGRAAAAAPARLLQAVVRAAPVVPRAVGEAHFWAPGRALEQGRHPDRGPTRAPPPPRPHTLLPSSCPPAWGPLTVVAEAALPALAAVTAEVTHAIDARAVAAARVVAWMLLGGPHRALVPICDMGFGSCHWCHQPHPCPHSAPPGVGVRSAHRGTWTRRPAVERRFHQGPPAQLACGAHGRLPVRSRWARQPRVQGEEAFQAKGVSAAGHQPRHPQDGQLLPAPAGPAPGSLLPGPSANTAASPTKGPDAVPAPGLPRSLALPQPSCTCPPPPSQGARLSGLA